MDTCKAKLAELTRFIDNTNSTIDKLLNDLGWTREVLLSKNKISPGRQNSSRSRAESVNQHNSKSLIEEPLPESFLVGKHPSSIKLDCDPGHIPNSHEDLITNFTREERLAMYEQAIALTPKHEPLPELQLNFKKRNNHESLVSLADIAAYRRDTHRRSQKYRFAKNPLSYQEEMRNLIQLQTDALGEYLGQSKDVDTGAKDRKADSSRSRPLKPQSLSRETEKRRDSRDVDERDKHKDRKSKKRKRSRSRSGSRHKHKSKKSRSKDKSKHKSRH